MQKILAEKGYEVSKELAKGRFANVFLCNDESNEYACKVFKDPARKNHSKMFNQITILEEVNHENIIKIRDHFQDGKIMFVVTEYCEFGNLSDFFNGGFIEHVRESTIRKISRDMLAALSYLDGINVIHGYVHPKTVFVKDHHENENGVKLLDIKLGGFSRSIKVADVNQIPDVKKVEGSPTYFAPERFLGEYGKGGDIWSLGVLLFQVTYGRFPYAATSFDEMKTSVCNTPFDGNKQSDDEGPWFPSTKVISSRGNEVFAACLTHSKDARPKAADILKFKWFEVKESANAKTTDPSSKPTAESQGGEVKSAKYADSNESTPEMPKDGTQSPEADGTPAATANGEESKKEGEEEGRTCCCC